LPYINGKKTFEMLISLEEGISYLEEGKISTLDLKFKNN